MSRETRERVEFILEKSEGVTTLDVTGGAPELAPEFSSEREEDKGRRAENYATGVTWRCFTNPGGKI